MFFVAGDTATFISFIFNVTNCWLYLLSTTCPLCCQDLYRMQGDHAKEQEGAAMHATYSQTLLKDHFSATQMAEHQLINWTDGSFPQF